MIVPLPASNRSPLRYRADNGTVIAFTHHAAHRAAERGIDPEELLRNLAGKKLTQYRGMGVAAQWNPGRRYLRIITVWRSR